MPSDYSRLMAEMIAAARPKTVSTGGGHTTMGGGRRGGFGTEKMEETKVSVGVNVDALARLFGYKTPEEKRKLADDLYKRLESMGPEEQKKMMADPRTQAVIGAAIKAGVPLPGFVTTDKPGVFEYVPTAVGKAPTEYKRTPLIGEPTQPKIEAGMFGAQPREQLIEARPKTETEILAGGGEEAARFIESRATLTEREALAAETPAKKSLLTSQAQMNRATAELHRIQKDLENFRLKMAPEDWKLDEARKQAETKYFDAKTREADAHAQYYMEQAEKELEKEQLQYLKGAQATYKQSQGALIKALTDAVQALDRDKILRVMTSVTTAYINSIQQATTGMKGGPTTGPANEAVAFWVDTISPELAKAPKEKGIIWKELDPMDVERYQRYGLEARHIIQSMGKDLDLLLAQRLLSVIQASCMLTPPTNTSINLGQWAVSFGEVIGVDMKELREWTTGKMKSPKEPTAPEAIGVQ